MTRSITRLVLGIIVSLAATSASRAANDVWDNNPIPPGDVRWENGTNWMDGTTPGNGDTATFNLLIANQVAFAAPPAAIQALTVSAPVSFQSSGGAKTLSVTSASGGQDVTIGAAVLALGTSGNPMHLTVGDDLTVSGGALLNATSGSQVNTLDLLLATVNGGGNGAVVVDGTNSQLNVTNNISMGLFGNAATLVYQNDAQGTLTGSVTLANSGNSASAATLTVASSANLTTGSLAVGTGTAAATGTINIHGAGSTLVQSGASTLVVGTAAAGIGALNIGTTSNSGTLTTGTGLFTINATGAVTIGSATTTGILNAKGNVTIDGGVLTSALNSDFNLTNGKTMTIQNGGSASFTDSYDSPSNATYNVSGTNSKLEILGNPLGINDGAQLNVSSGGSVSALRVHVGLFGAGTLIVDGSTVTATTGPSLWGHSAPASNVTFRNGAVGMMAALKLADNPLANSGVVVNIESGADLSVGDLSLAADGGTSAILNVQGIGSTITQSAASTLTIGHAASGTAAINIGTTVSGAVLTTGTGLTTINKTGTVTIGSVSTTGTLNAKGNVTIDGGVLDHNAGTFTLAPGKNFTAQNNGNVSFVGAYTVNGSSIYTIEGGADFSTTSSLTIGSTTNGTMTVDGANSTLAMDNLSVMTNSVGPGLVGTLTLSNSAVATQNGTSLVIGQTAFANTANLNVQSGAVLNSSATTFTVQSSGKLNITGGGIVTADGDLSVNSAGGTGGTIPGAEININGGASAFSQSGSNTITVGHVTTGTAAINIGTTTTGGTLTTGTGLTTINKTGTVTIGSGTNTGTLNANGDVLIDGGVLDHNAGPFTLASGKNLTTRNDGVASFTGLRVIDDGSTYLIQSGADFSTNVLGVGFISGNGTLTVDGLGSTISAAGGGAFRRANVTFSNGATGSFSAAVIVADSTTAGTTGTVNVQSGADVSLETLHLATVGGATTTGSFTVDGAGSTVTQTGGVEIVVGSTSTGTGTLTASNAGTFTAITSTTVASTGLIQVLSGGAYNTGGNVAVNTSGAGGAGARININGVNSAFTQSGATTLTVGHATTGTAAINIGTTANGGNLTTGTGLFTINPTGTVTIGSATTGGSLNTNGAVLIDGGVLDHNAGTFTLAPGKNFTAQNNGNVSFVGAYTVNGSSIYTIRDGADFSTTSTVTIGSTTNGTMTVSGSGSSLSTGLINIATSGAGPGLTGVLTVTGAGASVVQNGIVGLTIGQTAFANSATLNVDSGATFTNSGTGLITVNSTGLLSVDGGSFATGGNVNVNSAGGSGGTGAEVSVNGSGAVFTQSGTTTLTVGHATTGTAAINIGTTTTGGTLTTGTGLFTINATGAVTIGSATTTGTLNARANVTIDGGTINLVAGTLHANAIALNSGAFNFSGGTLHVAAFNGNLINQGGTLAPGDSAGSSTIVGSYTQQSGAALEIEIGGLLAGGTHDLVSVTGNANLGGELQLTLIGAFVPAAANTFTVLNATGIFGVFSNVTNGQRLTTIDGIGSFLVHYGAGSIFNQNQIVLNAFQLAALPGDYNLNGVVDAADYVVWRKTSGTPAGYAMWRANFGRTAGSGAGASVNATVPEPATHVLLLVGMLALLSRRRVTVS